MTNETEILQQFSTRRYDPDYIPKLDHKLFTVRDRLVGSVGNWITLTGLPKTGKSLFLSAIVASAFSPIDNFQMKLSLPKDRGRVCYIDTESGEHDMYRQMERIRKFIGVNRLPSNLDAFSVREDNHTIIIVCYLQELLLHNNV